MKVPITLALDYDTMRARCLRATGLAVAITCLLSTPPLRAADVHRGGQQHSQGHAPRQVARHDDRGHGYDRGRGYDRGYGGGYGYGGPPVVYAPETAPGINLFLPL